jgi:cytochrome c-type biogenesis protein
VFRIDVVRQAAGVLVIALGVLMTGAFGPVLDRLSIGVSPQSLPAARSVRSASLGALVAVGWTPCIGPVLSAILTMGFSSADVGIAAVLLIAYSAGLAVPFLAAALALPRLRPIFELLRRHHGAVEVASGLFVIGVGILILTNAFARMAGLFTFVL